MTKIIPASILDLNALRHLEQICFPKDAWPLFDLIAVLTFGGVARLKAVEDAQMVGFIAGDPRPCEKLAWIATIGVLPEYRGRGIARALLELCEIQLKQPRIRLSVRLSNYEAIRMYQNAGYSSVDQWRNYYDDGENALILEKRMPQDGT